MASRRRRKGVREMRMIAFALLAYALSAAPERVASREALARARLCYDILMEHGVDAKRAVEKKIVTPAVEKVVASCS